MLQHTNWIGVLFILAGLASLFLSTHLVFVKKVTNRRQRLFAGGLFCLATGIFEFLLRQSLPGYFPGALLFVVVIGLIFYRSRPLVQATSLPDELPADTLAAEPAMEPQANRPGLSIEQSLKLRKAIGDYLSTSLAFRRPGYTIRDLAAETGIPGYMISMFINQEYGMNFNELINAYRVEYLARVFHTSFDYKTYTLEALGKMAGFNSRTAFIASIKKHTGMTPSVFFGRKQADTPIPLIFKVPELKLDVA